MLPPAATHRLAVCSEAARRLCKYQFANLCPNFEDFYALSPWKVRVMANPALYHVGFTSVGLSVSVCQKTQTWEVPTNPYHKNLLNRKSKLSNNHQLTSSSQNSLQTTNNSSVTKKKKNRLKMDP
jgi:hypothetical protein